MGPTKTKQAAKETPMKKHLLFALVTVALMAFTIPNLNASVDITGYQYVQNKGTFVVNVKATEPWVLWRTTNFKTWKRVSKVMNAGQTKFTAPKMGLQKNYAFYVALPKGHHPKNGNHYGWSKPNNPHNTSRR